MKSVFITGANKGIGLETAKQLSQQGLFVYLGSRDIKKGNAIVKELSEEGFKNMMAVEIDVTRQDTILSARSIIEKQQGHLDILINNAG
jgi:NADP-dependent 3-hydroxy acid dehydrogenase YdfG